MDQPIRVAQVMGKMVGGGLEAVVMNYYRHIDRSRIQFDFIIDSDSTYVPTDEILSLGGCIYPIAPYQHMLRYMKEFKDLNRMHCWPIVHSHMNTLSVFPLRVAKKVGVPIRIAHNHATAGKGEYAKNALKYVLRPFASVYPTHRLACSDNAGKWLFGRKPYTIMVNAFEVDKMAYDEEKRGHFREQNGLSDNAFVFGHAGRFAPPKNQGILIREFAQAAKTRSNIVLMLAGQGPDVASCKELANELEVADKTIFLGQLDDIGAFYSAIDAFFLPSTYEGLGLALVEAQAACLPCYASSTVTQEANPTGNVVFLDLEDQKRWSDCMVAAERRTCRVLNSGEKAALDAFDINQAATRLVEYYEGLMAPDSVARD